MPRTVFEKFKALGPRECPDLEQLAEHQGFQQVTSGMLSARAVKTPVNQSGHCPQAGQHYSPA
jgi:hypothetical protein